MYLKVPKIIPLIGLLCSPAIAAPPYPGPSDSIPDDMVISMQRGNCEINECPIYRLLVFGNGDVIWQGRGRVAKQGVALSRIEPDRVRALIQDFESVDYFHLENIYGYRGSGCQSSAPEMPMVTTSLSMGGLSKTLSHHDGCVGAVSEKLTALENNIDKAIGADRWITGKRRHG